MERQRGDTARRLWGWSLAALVLALFGTTPLSLSGGVLDRPGLTNVHYEPVLGIIVAGFAIAGAGLVHLRPRNWIGWILLASGLFQVTNLAADAYSIRALTDPDRSLPLGIAAAWVASWTWLPSLLLPALVLPALYPTGRTTSRYWTWHVRAALVGTLLACLLLGLGPGGVDDSVPGTELPFALPAWLGVLVAVPAAGLLVASAVSVLLGTTLRAVRASFPERQQLLWLIIVVALMVATVFGSTRYLFATTYGLVPVAVAVGVLRYRLLGIEVVLRRTLLYLPITVLVALLIGGLTTLLARLVPEGPLPLLAASAVVAVIVIPLAARLRVLVDRLVLGERADPLTVVDRLGAGLEVADADPVSSMLEAVASATGTPYAAVHDATGQVQASVGVTTSIGLLDLPLRHGGETLGRLTIAPRRGAGSVSVTDRRLVTALAPHLAVVIQLDEERRRVTTATLAERDRLRRDLHDGLGPSLSGIALGLEAAAAAQATDDAAVRELLARTRAEAEAAVREVRRVIDGLRPTALDLHDLEGAVRSTASSLGMGGPGGPAFAVDADPLPGLTPQVEEAAYRIVAESLTNVVRHARAEHCVVRLTRVNGDLRVMVTDDGRGPDGVGPSAGGHGLDSMRRRATDLGGTLDVAADASSGTIVTARLPLGGGS